jgi:hypothetical protein
MQSELIETLNRNFHPANPSLPQPTTAQHGSHRPRSGSPDDEAACSPSPDACGSLASGNFDTGRLGKTLGRLSVDETKTAAAPRASVAGQRIADYENAAISSSPRHSNRPALGFKVVGSSRSGGVQLTDFPNGSLVTIGNPLCHCCCCYVGKVRVADTSPNRCPWLQRF